VGAAAAVDGSTADVADDMHFPSMPALRGLMDEFIDNGCTIWGVRGVHEAAGDHRGPPHPRAAIIGAARVVEEIAAGAQNITFA
jgi:hypothetical protein